MKSTVIVADHTCMVEAIRIVLRQTAGLRLEGVIDGRKNARAALRDLRPDVAIVDDMQDPEHALARMREITDELPGTKVVLLAQRMDRERAAEVFAAGADALISKAVHPVALATLVRETTAGNVLHNPASVGGAPDLGDCPLTARELEILGHVAAGETNGRIARNLWVTEQTVKFHLSNIYRKLGVANRTEASHYAHVHALPVEPRNRDREVVSALA